MTDQDPPSNDNRTFASLFRKGPRDRAHDILARAVQEMGGIGIDRATIIRSLFDHFIHELGKTPKSDIAPDHVEHMETTAILNEVNDRWRALVRQMEQEAPDVFQSHIP